MEGIGILLGVAVGLVAGGVAALVSVRAARRDATTERDAAVAAAVDAAVSLAVDRVVGEAEVRLGAHTNSTVDTVLAVAGDKLGAQSDVLVEQMSRSTASVSRDVGDVREELREMRALVAALQRDKAMQHGEFVERLEEARRTSETLAASTQHLREALSNSRARGQWGERMAEDILRTAGLIEGLNYRRQMTTDAGRPDITVLMPEGRELHVDVKFPLDNYLRVLEAPTDAERATATKAFIRDVRARVKELAARGYADPARSVEFVVAFIPNEAVYGFVHEQDPGILDEAARQKVVLCGPFSFMAVLGVVRQAVEAFQLERTSDEILERLSAFGRQWGMFTDTLDKVGRQFGTAQRSLDELTGTRRRQLERELDAIERLRGDRGLEPAVREHAPAAFDVDTAAAAVEDGEVVADVAVGEHLAPSAERGPRRLRPVRLR